MGCRILESEYYSALSREGFCIANRDLSTNGTKLHENGVAFSLCENVLRKGKASETDATTPDCRPEKRQFGRLERRDYCPAGSNVAAESVQVVYDALGRQSQVVEARGTTDYAYDVEGRLTQIQSPEGALNYDYDAVTGRKVRTWTANSDQRYSYDELGRLKTVSVHKRGGVSLSTPEVTTYSYTKVGSRESVELPNGVLTQYQYDNLNRLTSLAHYNAADELLGSYSYSLAPNGRRTGVAEQRREADNSFSNTNVAYTFDKMNRLVNEVSSSSLNALNYSNAYAYDLCGNRIRKSTSGILPETINYAYNKNDQLTTEASNVKGNSLYQYDDNGCLTSKTGGEESCAYSYNLQGRMSAAAISRVENGQNVTVNSSYTYDVSGIRTRANQTVNGVVQNRIFLVDGGFTGYAQILEEANQAGAAPIKSYVLGDDVLSQTVNGVTSHLMYDGHGSTRLLTDNAGAVTDRYDYDAYGKNLFDATNAATDMLYSGEQFDAGLQMQYLRARYYDQNTGRFNRVDDFAGNNSDPQSLHKYAYCHGDPVNGTDPSGEMGIIGVVAFIAVAIFVTAIAYHIPNELRGQVVGSRGATPVKADLIITSKSFLEEMPHAIDSMDGYGDVYVASSLKQLFQIIVTYSKVKSPSKPFSVKIVDHGNSGVQKFNGNQIEESDFSRESIYYKHMQIDKLKGKLSLIIFAGCGVGAESKGRSFLQKVAKELNTHATALTKSHFYSNGTGAKHRVEYGAQWKLFSSVGVISEDATNEELEKHKAF